MYPSFDLSLAVKYYHQSYKPCGYYRVGAFRVSQYSPWLIADVAPSRSGSMHTAGQCDHNVSARRGEEPVEFGIVDLGHEYVLAGLSSTMTRVAPPSRRKAFSCSSVQTCE